MSQSKKDAELDSLREVAIVIMFATYELCSFFKTQEVDVLTIGHT